MYLYNINTPSELTLDDTNNQMTNGDEFNLIITYNDSSLTYAVPEEGIGSVIRSKRNSIVRFTNLILPCEGLTLQLKEKDFFRNYRSELSNEGTFNCSELGVQEGAFHVGDDISRGRYRLVSNLVNSVEEIPNFDPTF